MKNDPSAVETPPEWSETLFTHLYRAKILAKQYSWVFLVTISLCIAYQAYKQLSQPKIYISSAQMIVSGRINIPEGSLYKEELSNFFGTQIQLMQSKQVQTRAKDRVLALNPELKPSGVNINVAQSPKASIFILRAQGVDPAYTQAYLNSTMQEYLNFKSEMRSQTAESTFISITDKILQLKDEIDVLEQKKLDFQKKNNLVFIQEQGSIAGSHLSELKNQLSKLNIKQRSLANIDLNKFLDKPSSPELEQIVRNPHFELDIEEYINLSDVIQRLEAERDEYLTYMKDNHPTIVELESEINRRENLLRVIRRQKVVELIENKESLQYEIGSLKTIITEWESKALDFSQRIAEYSQIESKLDRLKSAQEQLLTSTQSIDINRNLEQESVSILEEASPATVIKKNFLREITIGFFFGVFLGGAIIFAIGTIDSRVYSLEDLTDRYEEPIIGAIPRLEEDQSEMLLQRNDDRVVFAEALRNIRSSLIYLNREDINPKTFLIASSIPAEGKSTVANNLAIALAFSASKTLLVDADLRRGRLNTRLSLKNKPGLSEAITQKLKPEDYIQSTHIDDLDFISCGETPQNPGETLMNANLDKMIQEWKKSYDFIIFDSAPILATNDSINLATKLDGVLFVTRAAITRTRQVKSALQALHMHGPEIYGFILNSMETKGPNYHYYKYNDYY